MKKLPNHFYAFPDAARMTVTTKHLRELLLATDSQAVIKGKIWEIKSKSLGAGIYQISVEKRKYFLDELENKK